MDSASSVDSIDMRNSFNPVVMILLLFDIVCVLYKLDLPGSSTEHIRNSSANSVNQTSDVCKLTGSAVITHDVDTG